MSDALRPDFVRRALAIGALVTLGILRLDPQLLELPFIDRAPLQAAFAELADRTASPEYRDFLRHVRATTPPGASIAIVAPTLDWDAGYSYAYYRASYFLTGRVVLPVALEKGRLLPLNYRTAEYIAAWKSNVPHGHRTVLWRGEGGFLMRR